MVICGSYMFEFSVNKDRKPTPQKNNDKRRIPVRETISKVKVVFDQQITII